MNGQIKHKPRKHTFYVNAIKHSQNVKNKKNFIEKLYICIEKGNIRQRT